MKQTWTELLEDTKQKHKVSRDALKREVSGRGKVTDFGGIYMYVRNLDLMVLHFQLLLYWVPGMQVQCSLHIYTHVHLYIYMYSYI